MACIIIYDMTIDPSRMLQAESQGALIVATVHLVWHDDTNAHFRSVVMGIIVCTALCQY